MAAENEVQDAVGRSEGKIKQKNGLLHVKCPFCSTLTPHNEAIRDGCECGSSVVCELKYTTAGKVMHLEPNTDRIYAETESDDEIRLQGPFCDSWVSMSELEESGCECGASVAIDITFEK